MTKSWDEYREVIIAQYKEYNKPLHEVQRFMEDRHNFKASTRAYRSRFDKWGVHKYSCRKRKGSEGEQGDSEYDGNDHRTPPDMHSPDPERRDSQYGYLAEVDSSPSSSISASSHDRHYYGTGMGGTTPPSDLGSPIATSKFETPSPYHHQAPLTPPTLRHPMAMPATAQGYLADPQQYPYHHHFGHHPSPYGTQPTAADSYYRTAGPQDPQHIYHHLQAPEIDMDVHQHHHQHGYGYPDDGHRRGPV